MFFSELQDDEKSTGLFRNIVHWIIVPGTTIYPLNVGLLVVYYMYIHSELIDIASTPNSLLILLWTEYSLHLSVLRKGLTI